MNPLTAAIIALLIVALLLISLAYLAGRRHGHQNAMDETADTRVFAEHIVAELEAVGVDPDAFSTVWVQDMCRQIVEWRKEVETQFPWAETEMETATFPVQPNTGCSASSDEPTANEPSKTHSGGHTTLVSVAVQRVPKHSKTETTEPTKTDINGAYGGFLA